MSHHSIPSAAADFSPLGLAGRSLPVQIAAVFLGTLVLTVSSYVAVPMIPVPITMQTLAVALIGALYGWRLGAITILAWLAQGAAGLPVFSGGASTLAAIMGPTGGYLMAFPIVGALVGWFAERGWNGRNVVLAFAAMMIGHALVLVAGAAWLAGYVGVEQAIALGVTPFLVGSVLKSALGAAVLKVLDKRVRA